MKTLAERLTWARTERELSQQQLADKAGVAQSTIGGLEAGARLSARKITAIADALEVSSQWLAEGRGPVDQIMAVPAHSTAAKPAADDRTLQWVGRDEAELLSLYRACGPTEQATSLVVLRSLPKAISDDRSDQA